jgi:hypothetical protein
VLLSELTQRELRVSAHWRTGYPQPKLQCLAVLKVQLAEERKPPVLMKAASRLISEKGCESATPALRNHQRRAGGMRVHGNGTC